MTQATFLKRLEELYAENVEISRKKNADYAGEHDPFKNFRLCEALGICSVEVGMLVRITDKLARVSNLLTSGKDPKVTDESVMDTLQDGCNYMAILALYLEYKRDSRVFNNPYLKKLEREA